MCEVAPGPRCSFDMSQKLKARVKAYNAAHLNSKTIPTQLNLLKAKVMVAQQEYDATPSGLNELKKELELNPTSKTIEQRYIIATITRQQQTTALEEIKNGRVAIISEIYETLIPGYDKEQISSLMETIREDEEKTAVVLALEKPVSDLNNPKTSTETQWSHFVEHLASLSPNHSTHIEKLKTLPAPDEENLSVYRNVQSYVSKSKQHLNYQIREIANLQNTNPNVALAHYNAYRNQYLNTFASLPASLQPNPPSNWVKGEFNNSGFAQSPTSKYAPHDKASMYAIHRLRSDETAIPDYMKQVKQYVEVSAGANNEIVVNTYSPSGKKVKETAFPANTKPGVIQYELEGKIMFQAQPGTVTNAQPAINSNDYVSKHFDFPSYRSVNIGGFLAMSEPTPAEIFFNAKKRVKKIWNSKPARAEAPPVTIDVFSIQS